MSTTAEASPGRMPRQIPYIIGNEACERFSFYGMRNILVQFLAGPWLTWGAFTYPFAFLVTDLTNRIHGVRDARRVVLAGFALAGMRLVNRIDDFFVRVATAGIVAWILLQATINIGAVIGMLPVIGVPLPFVSAGGSSLVTTMVAVGILLSFARHEPGAAELAASRPSRLAGMARRLPLRRSSSS